MSNSRFDYDDDYGDYPELDMGRWMHNSRAVVQGKRGQQVLRELVAALEAMPEKRLILGSLCDGDATCAVGELAVYRKMRDGQSRALAFWDVYLTQEHDYSHSGNETARFGEEELGLRFTLAWTIAQVNDEDFNYATPEERYEGVLNWARQSLRGSAAVKS